MKKRNILKWSLPALVMSAMTFELLPGSVQYYAKDFVADPEAAWNFFSPPVQSAAASYLSAAGLATAVALVLALAATCFGKTAAYKWTSWCSLAAGALTAMPYVSATADAFLQPNVVILLLLMAAWLVAMALDKKKDSQEKEKTKGRRL